MPKKLESCKNEIDFTLKAYSLFHSKPLISYFPILPCMHLVKNSSAPKEPWVLFFPLFPHFLYQPIIIFSLTMRLSFHLLNKPVRNFDAKSAPHPFLRIFSPLHYSSLWSFHSEFWFASEIPDRLGIFLKTDKTFRGQKVSPQSTYVWTGHTSFFIFHSFHPLSARWGTLSKQQKENALVWVSEIWAAIRVEEGNEILYAGRKKDFHMINCPTSVSSTLDRACLEIAQR